MVAPGVRAEVCIDVSRGAYDEVRSGFRGPAGHRMSGKKVAVRRDARDSPAHSAKGGAYPIREVAADRVDPELGQTQYLSIVIRGPRDELEPIPVQRSYQFGIDHAGFHPQGIGTSGGYRGRGVEEI